MSRVLVLTYHALEEGPPPLCIDPTQFERHLEVMASSGATILTVRALAARIRAGELPERAVALTFDDGYASVADTLAGRGVPATVFCVARRLGGWSDWPSQSPSAPRLRLADAGQLRRLVAEGCELGSHGLDHDVGPNPADLSESRNLLERSTGAEVRSFAFPYGVVPRDAAAGLRHAGYEAACTTRMAYATSASDVLALPRVDAHYLRSPTLMRAALAGRLDLYLRGRAAGARIRRLARKDYVPA